MNSHLEILIIFILKITIPPNAVTEEDFMTFVGEKNTEYYLDKFERYQSNQNFASWNWAAFFLGMFWILYRKLYKFSGILFGINLLSVFLIGGSTLLNLVIMIGCGVYGNLVYVKDSLRKIENIKRFSSSISHMDLNNRLIHNGGVSFVGPIILSLLIIPIILITLFISLGLEISLDGEKWEVIDEITGESREDNFPTLKAPYRYRTTEGINKKARYI